VPRTLWTEEGHTEKNDGCLSKLCDVLIAIVAAALIILLMRLSR
jgi:hypothetical protein